MDKDTKALECLKEERAKVIDTLDVARRRRLELDRAIIKIEHRATVGKCYKDWCDDNKHTFYKPSFDAYTKVLMVYPDGSLKVLKFREFEPSIFTVSIEIVDDVYGEEISSIEFDMVFGMVRKKLEGLK